MKKLISEKTVEQAFVAGKMIIEIDSGTIITAQAESVAANLGVELIKNISKKTSYTDRQKIIDGVVERFPCGKFSRAKIEKAVQDVLNSSL